MDHAEIWCTMVDGIYLGWSSFAKTNTVSITKVEIKYTKQHKYVSNDIEREFGVLISKYDTLEWALRGWFIDDIHTTMIFV